jgi:hypothetical protein
MNETDDKAYSIEAPRSLGRFVGDMFAGMVEAGMSRKEALEVVNSYLWATINKPRQEEEDPS